MAINYYVPLDLLKEAIDKRLVREIPDPQGTGYNLYCYTADVQQGWIWNEATIKCRGLVLDSNYFVIARPFKKFFGYGQDPSTCARNLPAEVPIMAPKIDGSLIVAWWSPLQDRWRCSSKGSFDSEQATAAWEFLYANIDTEKMDKDFTYLFEFTAPWNRIVVAYPKEELHLIGVINKRTGLEFSYPYCQTEAVIINATPLANVSQQEIHKIDVTKDTVNEEGFVFQYSNGLRVKLKYDKYLELHRMLTGFSVKAIWEMLKSGKRDIPEDLPDEFLKWFRLERKKLEATFSISKGIVEEVYKQTFEKLGEYPERKQIAQYWFSLDHLQQFHRSCLFKKLDGGDYDNLIWKAIKPQGQTTFTQDTDR